MRWFVFWAMAAIGVAQVKSVPLFTIEKSSNKNRVQYDARLTADGHFDSKQPIVAYWIMAAEDGRRQELNLLERAKAYGFTLHQDGLDSYRLWVVSHREKEIHVYRDGERVKAEAVIGGRVSLVDKIYIQMHKTLLLSLPEFGEMFGFDKQTGEHVVEKVTRTEQ
jgi:hypothetical protein